MRGTSWATGDPHHAAGGRRRYNAERAIDAKIRQLDVLCLLRRYGRQRGVQARIARELGVSPATISRDVAALFGRSRCSTCGGPDILIVSGLPALEGER